MKQNRQITVTLDERLYKHLEAIRQIKAITDKRTVPMCELFREAVKHQYGYYKVSVDVKEHSPVVVELMKDGN